jgi:hypothetical protein
MTELKFNPPGGQGLYSPPLRAFNAFDDTPLLCGGAIHFLGKD